MPVCFSWKRKSLCMPSDHCAEEHNMHLCMREQVHTQWSVEFGSNSSVIQRISVAAYGNLFGGQNLSSSLPSPMQEQHSSPQGAISPLLMGMQIIHVLLRSWEWQRAVEEEVLWANKQFYQLTLVASHTTQNVPSSERFEMKCYWNWENNYRVLHMNNYDGFFPFSAEKTVLNRKEDAFIQESALREQYCEKTCVDFLWSFCTTVGQLAPCSLSFCCCFVLIDSVCES